MAPGHFVDGHASRMQPDETSGRLGNRLEAVFISYDHNEERHVVAIKLECAV
jgi:hypothetical protein